MQGGSPKGRADVFGVCDRKWRGQTQTLGGCGGTGAAPVPRCVPVCVLAVLALQCAAPRGDAALGTA